MAAINDGDIGKLESPAVHSNQLHVLVVDDSLVNRTVIERLLRVTSCKVTVVDSGLQALQFLGLDHKKASVEVDRLKVDMIFTDYSMPGMTGYELLKKIKVLNFPALFKIQYIFLASMNNVDLLKQESTSFGRVPVVIMSSKNVKSRIERCHEEGAVEFLLKPVKLTDVKRLTEALKSTCFEEIKSI